MKSPPGSDRKTQEQARALTTRLGVTARVTAATIFTFDFASLALRVSLGFLVIGLPLLLSLLSLESIEPLLTPAHAIDMLHPEHAHGDTHQDAQEGKAPAIPHAAEHGVDDGGSYRAKQAADEIASCRGRGCAVWEQVHDQGVERVQGGDEAEPDDELEDQRGGQVGPLLQSPAVWDESDHAEGHGREDGLQAGALDRVVAEVVAFLAVNGKAQVAGYAGIVPVDDFAIENGGDAGSDAQGTRGKYEVRTVLVEVGTSQESSQEA